MTLREALKDILSPIADVDRILSDPELSTQAGLEFVVAFALTYAKQKKLSTQASNELASWYERRMSA